MKKILTILILSLFAVSCGEDFLERTNPNALSNESFWSSEKDAQMAIRGCYDVLQSGDYYDSGPWSAGIFRTDFMSDNGYCVWGSWMPGGATARGKISPSNTWSALALWEASYTMLGRTNRVIEFVPGMAEKGILSQEKADQIVAEAKFLRAMTYNLLTMTFVDVPCVKKPLTLEECEVGKTPKSEIVTFMTEDLEGAIEHLPEAGSTEFGRATKGAGLALLARIYLYHGQYDKAAQRAQDVMNLGNYSLFSDYHELFTPENETASEVIFSVRFERGLGGNEGANFPGYWGNATVVHQAPLANLAESFYCTDGLPIDQSPRYNPDLPDENRDPRFNATVVAKGSTWRGDSLASAPSTPTDYAMRKYTEEDNNLNQFDSPQDFYVFRYAHVLLIRAEALVQSGNYNISEVVGLVNQLRDRVGMPRVQDVEGTGLGQQELLELVKHERRVETALEGLRYFDLKRWGELKERAFDYYMQNEASQYGLAERVWSDKMMKWPIPQPEIDVNENLSQHPEWQ